MSLLYNLFKIDIIGGMFMNITLPCTNLKTSDLFIQNGILRLRYGKSFHDTIYSLTYFMKGHHYCYYCKKHKPRSEMSLDHIYPRTTGGPTLPQNLIPACKDCNTTKSILTLEQFKNYQQLGDDTKKRDYMNLMWNYKEGLKKIGIYEFPNSWLSEQDIDKIHTTIIFSFLSKTKIEKKKLYFKTYRHFQSPVILDRNFFILDGFYTFYLAKLYGIRKVPCIILTNVEVKIPQNTV